MGPSSTPSFRDPCLLPSGFFPVCSYQRREPPCGKKTKKSDSGRVRRGDRERGASLVDDSTGLQQIVVAPTSPAATGLSVRSLSILCPSSPFRSFPPWLYAGADPRTSAMPRRRRTMVHRYYVQPMPDSPSSRSCQLQVLRRKSCN
jgi:hypothetical protein